MNRHLSDPISVSGGSIQSLSPTPPSRNVLTGLKLFQGCWLVFFAFWMPISITALWIGLGVGTGLWILVSALSIKESVAAVPENENLSKFYLAKERFLSIAGLSGAPFLFPLLVFILAVLASGFYIGCSDPYGSVMKGLWVGFRGIATLQTFIVYPWAYQTFNRAPFARTWAMATLLAVGSLSSFYAPIEPYAKLFMRQLIDNPPTDLTSHWLVVLATPLMKWITGSRVDFLQGTGFLEQPMSFAGQMQLLLMLALALFLCGGYKALPAIFSKRWMAVLVPIAIILGIVFGAERSAWLGTFFGVIILCGSISRKILLRSLLCIVVVGALSYAFVPIVKDRINPLFTGEDASVTTRFEIWKRSFELFQKKPIFGNGIRRFPHIYVNSAMPDKGFLDHAHNNYLHILATTGIVGFAAYLYMLAAIFTTTAKLSRSGVLEGLSEKEADQLKYKRSLAIGLLAGTAALCVSGLFEYNFGTGHVRLTYFFLLAFLSRKI